MDIIYAKKINTLNAYQLTDPTLKQFFWKAISINRELLSSHKRVAYFFIDPLMNHFEAANRFYFDILECESVTKLNSYRSGAGPIMALSDAKELIENDLCDAVYIFGCELLLTDTDKYGRDAIKKAMAIFDGTSLVESYNLLARQICSTLHLPKQQFLAISNKLYENYLLTYHQNYESNINPKRGRFLDDLKADLFRLSDCANPNVDFAGGLIVVNPSTAVDLGIPGDSRIQVLSSRYNVIKGHPDNVTSMVGEKDNIFPHLREAFRLAQNESQIDVVQEFLNGDLLLEVYTCYPPIPIAFLLSTGMINDISELPGFLGDHQITITGGLNLAKAPWSNPVLNSLADMIERMKRDAVQYGLVHGNGGLGEVQGVAILKNYLL